MIASRFLNLKQAGVTVLTTLILVTGCQKKLDLFPVNTVANPFTSAQGYDQFMAKVYASYALTGNDGPTGKPDVSGDEGFSEFVRGFWNLQQLPTDEAIVSWGDIGLPDFHNMSWTPQNGFIRQLYARSFYQITAANQFLEEATDVRLSGRNIGGDDAARIRGYRYEARFLRAFQYWVLMDMFGNVPFTEEVSTKLPGQIKRADLFAYIERELKDIEPNMLEAHLATNYGRADKGAAAALLARLYLNAEVYTGTARYQDAALYAKKAIDYGYTLAPNYRNLAVGDNNMVSASEFILTVNYDGSRSKTYGGTTFLGNASNSSDKYSFKFAPLGTIDTVKQNINYGNGGWNGLRVLSTLEGLFPDSGRNPEYVAGKDNRAQFLSVYLGKTKRGGRDSLHYLWSAIPDLTNNDYGWRCFKYRHLTSTGAPGSDPGKLFSDADFPLFRLGEMYLIYAECAARGAADVGTAVQYINNLRGRAYGNSAGNVSAGDVTPEFVLAERSRELYWEGHRRTDLIRFGKFAGGGYVWPLKAGVVDGADVPAFRNLYPLPFNDMTANGNLVQNPGYN